MSKYIKKPKALKAVKSNEPEIPKDLLDLWGAVEATSTCFAVMNAGSYKHDYLNSLTKCLGFLAKLHESTMEAVLRHPQCDLLSGVRAYKEDKAKKEAQDGEKAITQ